MSSSKNPNRKSCLRLRKFIFNNHVLFITTSVERGIMLPANPLSKFVIKAALLRAQRLHDLKISHFIVNGTHIHMIIRVENPEDVPDFMERFKTESATYINHILGREKGTVWCDGYDSPDCLNLGDVMEKIVYLYDNPVKDGLIESIYNYPGLSTWHIFNGNQKRIFGTFLSRNDFYPISQEQDYLGFKKCAKRLAKLGTLKEVKFDTNDWFKAFGITEQEEIDDINDSIRTMVKEREKAKQEEYEEEKKSFMGRIKLENQGIDVYYERKKQKGRKHWVICSDKEQRKLYIAFLKELAGEAREVYEAWCKGDTSRRMPIGVFAPRMPVVANLINV